MTRARALALQLRDRFAEAGAEVVEPPMLLPADTFLDLYGEDIRGRAYVTADALRGEQMLRPDFTVPVVQVHLAEGAATARYTYAGEVFRRQDDDPERDNEYLQVGFEVFDATDPAAADAEVFATLADAVAHLPVRAATGDIGILMAAVDGLRTTDRRKAALRRHIWRPRRFRALLDRFGGRSDVPASRAALLSGQAPVAGPMIGLRSRAEINARVAALREDAAAEPLSGGELDGLDALLNVRETLPYALEQLQDLSVDLPSISGAVHRLRKRADALDARGLDVSALEFEASYGRTSMEYYSGFVFGFYAAQRPDLPPVVSGGRYDALTRRLGGDAAVPAVGAVARPGLMAALEGEA